jgi:hypothetical protein
VQTHVQLVRHHKSASSHSFLHTWIPKVHHPPRCTLCTFSADPCNAPRNPSAPSKVARRPERQPTRNTLSTLASTNYPHTTLDCIELYRTRDWYNARPGPLAPQILIHHSPKASLATCTYPYPSVTVTAIATPSGCSLHAKIIVPMITETSEGHKKHTNQKSLSACDRSLIIAFWSDFNLCCLVLALLAVDTCSDFAVSRTLREYQSV